MKELYDITFSKITQKETDDFGNVPDCHLCPKMFWMILYHCKIARGQGALIITQPTMLCNPWMTFEYLWTWIKSVIKQIVWFNSVVLSKVLNLKTLFAKLRRPQQSTWEHVPKHNPATGPGSHDVLCATATGKRYSSKSTASLEISTLLYTQMHRHTVCSPNITSQKQVKLCFWRVDIDESHDLIM